MSTVQESISKWNQYTVIKFSFNEWIELVVNFLGNTVKENSKEDFDKSLAVHQFFLFN